MKENIFKKLEIQRAEYDEKWGKLILSQKLDDFSKELEEAGEPLPVILSYGNRADTIQIFDYLDKEFYNKYGIIPLNPIKEMFKLLKDELKAEFKFRAKTIKEFISKKGLEKYTQEIIEGMNKSCSKVIIPWDDISVCHPFYLRYISQTNSIELLKFSLDYVNRWERYNKLFVNKV